MIAYGTAIRRKKSGKILDVEIESSREEAQRLVDRQNEREKTWDLRTEWVVVEIEVAA